MDHDGAVLFVVRTDVAKVEAFRQIIVHLHGAKLPLTTDHVLDHKVDFGAIEGGFAGLFDVVDIKSLRGFAKSFFGLVPFFRLAHVFCRIRVTQSDTHPVVSHVEGIKNEFDQVETAFDFLAELLFSTKDVGIILSKTTDSSHAIEFARLLPAINGAKFG